MKLYEQRPALNLYEWSVNDVDADLDQVGLAGSPTKVKRTFTPVHNKTGVKLEGKSAQESVSELMNLLTDAKIL